MAVADDKDDKDNLSSVSTILGLALFCLVITTILIRRMMVHRARRMYALPPILSNSNIHGGGVGEDWRWSRRRGRVDSFDEDEPRRIMAFGARAMKQRPMIHSQHLFPLSDQVNSSWVHLQPSAFQLQTSHTTTTPHFPRRRLEQGVGGNNTTDQGIDSREGDKPHETPLEKKSGVEEDRTYPHPVLLTFLIALPDSNAPLYTPTSGSTTAPSTTTPPMAPPATNPSATGHLPLLALGTTHPIARLPSIMIAG